ncbi:MAG: LacI family DNA-binding transcriptional regulator [Kiritimatiellia bacterium]|jgi:DNA-binding LacI/PurR family transcriptional regulator
MTSQIDNSRKIRTQDELARLAGVTRVTVNRALMGKPNVNPETRARILALAAKCGYQPNAMARAISRRTSPIVGVVMVNTVVPGSALTNLPYFELLMGIDAALRRRGCVPALVGVSPTGAESPQESRLFTEHWVDGVVAIGSFSSRVEKRLASMGSRIVCVESNKWEETGCIRRDERHAARLLAKNLIAQGSGPLLWIDHPAGSGRRTHFNAIEQRAGFFEEAHAAKLEVGSIEIERGGKVVTAENNEITTRIETPESLEKIVANVKPFLGSPCRVGTSDAVLALNFRMAAARLGKFAGRDYSIGCGSDSTMIAQFQPELSRVSFDRFAMGALAVSMLLDEDADAPSRKQKGKWIEGLTTSRWNLPGREARRPKSTRKAKTPRPAAQPKEKTT